MSPAPRSGALAADVLLPPRLAVAEERTYTGLRPLRTVAMVSILAHHVTWKPLFGVSFGLVTLQVLTVALVARRPRAPGFATLARKRARRLLAPWLFWSGVYGLVEVALALRWHQPVASRFDGAMWFAGTAYHLWFLPYAFVAACLAWAGARASEGARARSAIPPAALAGAALVLASGALQQHLAPPRPFHLWLDGAPALCFGLAAGRALSLPGSGERLRALALTALFAVLPWCLEPALASLGVGLPRSHLAARYALAVPLACAGFLVRLPDSGLVTALAGCNLGVYVAHVLCIRLVDRLPPFADAAAGARVAAVYLFSLGLVLLLRRTRLLRFA